MEKLTQMIKQFNKSRSESLFKKVIENIFRDYKKCSICENHILYYDTKIQPKKLDLKGKSFKSFKIVNGVKYNLSVCESCLTKKYPSYQNKNKSRVFNQMNKYSKYAYQISENDYKSQKDKYVLTTKDSMIRKYGEKEGINRWNNYIEKQSYTNSFEYKKSKYGWDKNMFDEYNKSRSITLDNLINKYGEKVGTEKWEDYIEKQKYTKSKEYYVEKYGEDKWIELCKSKAHTYKNYIKWYGSEEKALEKIKDRHKIWNSVSKSSQKYLSEFDKYLKSLYNVKTYYNNLNKEYMIITESRDIYYLDYFIKDWKIGIEYNGDLFHANPKIYLENDTPIPNSKLTSKEIWERDRLKKETIEKERNIKIITIWESELPNCEKLIEIINGKRL